MGDCETVALRDIETRDRLIKIKLRDRSASRLKVALIQHTFSLKVPLGTVSRLIAQRSLVS
ncbi:MAG: hypothetical protein AAFQ83_19850 [Bacteroidota bacterium]